VASWLWGAGAALLGAILLWGLISPRSQWRVLVGWSTSDPDRAEPGDSVHGLTRLISCIGLLAVLGVIGGQAWSAFADRPQPAIPLTPVERMWGRPVPGLVDRFVVPIAQIPEDLVLGPLEGYEAIDRGWAPDYLVGVPRWTFLGEARPEGLIGVYPGDGFTGYGVSDLIVAASGPMNCIPRLAVVVESESQLEVAVAWGLPGAADQDHVAACAIREGELLQTVLVPVQLSGAVEGRAVVTFDGVPLVPRLDQS